MNKILRILFNVLWTVILIAFSPFLIILSLATKDKLLHRLGFWGELPQVVIWIHCASVGEAKVAIIFSKILKEYKHKILYTVATPSGYRYLKNNIDDGDFVRILPVDHQVFIWNALRRLDKIEALVMVETEYWLNLISALKRRKVPIFVVNGKVSKTTKSIIQIFGRDLLDSFEYFCVINEKTKLKLLDLNVPKSRIEVCGNLKSVLVDHPEKDNIFNDDEAIWVCGSTRPKEEEVILKAFQKLRTQYKDLKLVLAPRHIRRVAAVEKMVKDEGLLCSKFSEQLSTDVVIVDVMGELHNIYRNAKIAFVGGTLSDHGGHNPLEPAFWAKPVIFGPFYSSASESYEALLQTEGGFVVKDALEIETIISKLLSDDKLCAIAGENAKKAVQMLNKESVKYCDFVDRFFSGESG